MTSRMIVVALATILIFSACKKNDYTEQARFFGMWINTTAPGDTLQFFYRDSQPVLWYNQSFNPGKPAFIECPYDYRDGKLYISITGQSGTLKQIDSFTWTKQYTEFSVLGYQIYPFMSSTTTVFTYRKAQ